MMGTGLSLTMESMDVRDNAFVSSSSLLNYRLINIPLASSCHGREAAVMASRHLILLKS
jgi:hypothetical protein